MYAMDSEYSMLDDAIKTVMRRSAGDAVLLGYLLRRMMDEDKEHLRGAEIAAARRQAAEAFYSSMLQEVSETQQKGAAMLRAYVD